MDDKPGIVYKPRIIYSALKYSKKAYEGIPEAIEFHDSGTSTTAYLLIMGNVQVLAFRGSKEQKDFLIDGLAIPWRYKGRWAHRGFVKAHSAVWDLIKQSIQPGLPLIITGHSLGGALAELSAWLMWEHEAPVHMVTFGKPNVFFRVQVPRMQHLKTQLSVVSGSDLVTRIPRILYGPDPGQEMLYLANDGNDYLNPDKKFVREDFGVVDALSDHSMDLYYDRVKRICHY